MANRRSILKALGIIPAGIVAKTLPQTPAPTEDSEVLNRLRLAQAVQLEQENERQRLAQLPKPEAAVRPTATFSTPLSFRYGITASCAMLPVEYIRLDDKKE